MIQLAHSTSTIAMCAVIWFVQLVHYPLFARVGAAEFKRYEAEHVRRITWIVAPLMGVELVASAWLVVENASALRVCGLVLVGVVWSSTLLIQVPLHGALSKGFDAQVARRLVRSNWIRTIAWSARLGIVLAAP